MKEYQNLDPRILRATNSYEPAYEKTNDWLRKQHETGSWHQIPPVFAVLMRNELWTLDGNHRRDYAETNNLPLPTVIALENDEDLAQAKKRLGISYSKITRIDQLRRILEGRLK
jgi:hypothetical protein